MLWQYFLRPILFRFDPEWVHNFSMGTFRLFGNTWPAKSILRKWYTVNESRLATIVFGIDFANPVGLAAGFDKDARWYQALSTLGFGHVEVGTLTAHAQTGNPKPRLFRLERDKAIINRMGFNNLGSENAAYNFSRTQRPNCVLGINIGKSKITELEQAADDYLASLERLYEFSDYLTINVSSPNTQGLRQLQDREPLLALLNAVMERSKSLSEKKSIKKRPVLLKIAPDLNDHQLDDILDIAFQSGVDGIIATNTTISRKGLGTSSEQIEKMGAGGLSGGPLAVRSRQVVSQLYVQSQGKIPIVGVGGIMSGEDAWQMILAGASLVQVYTGFVYNGPGFVRELNRYISVKLKENSYQCVHDAVGKSNGR